VCFVFTMLKEHQIFNLISKIPKGKVTTYKILAGLLGVHPRKVAYFCKNNPKPVKIPCHRVVYSDGGGGGYAFGGEKIKKSLLKKEGISIRKDRVINFDKFLFKF